MSQKLKPIQQRECEVFFRHDVDFIDGIAASSLPADGPQNVDLIKTLADGNCMCRSVSQGYIGNDSMHLELRARIVIDGVINKKHYLSHDCLSRGATLCREGEPLPYLYVSYSDHYVNGQKITDNTVEYIYARKLHDCAKVNSYMGLWQIAIAANVLNITIQSVFPEGGDPVMRQDFNRLFFPVNSTPENTSDKLMIMWTSVRPNCVPSHFVPLLS